MHVNKNEPNFYPASAVGLLLLKRLFLSACTFLASLSARWHVSVHACRYTHQQFRRLRPTSKTPKCPSPRVCNPGSVCLFTYTVIRIFQRFCRKLSQAVNSIWSHSPNNLILWPGLLCRLLYFVLTVSHSHCLCIAAHGSDCPSSHVAHASDWGTHTKPTQPSGRLRSHLAMCAINPLSHLALSRLCVCACVWCRLHLHIGYKSCTLNKFSGNKDRRRCVTGREKLKITRNWHTRII